MSTDRKNNIRLDLNDIYRKCRDRSLLICRANNLDYDSYAITGNEVKYLHEFIMDGAARIADKAGYVKSHLQTGIDALSYYPEWQDEDEDGDLIIDTPDQNEEYTASEVATAFYTYTITDDNNIFTTNQTLSDLNNSHANLSTGDIFVLQAQTIESDKGTYRANAIGDPTKLSDLYTVIQVATFSSLPDFTLGEIVSDGTNRAKVIGLDTENEKAVLALADPTWFSATDVITGSTSSESGTISSETKHVQDTPVTVLQADVIGESKDSGERLDPSSAPDYIEFYGIDDLDDSSMIRYTVVQNLILEGLIAYGLSQWFQYVALFDIAAPLQIKFDQTLDSIKMNSVRRNRYKSSTKPYRTIG